MSPFAQLSEICQLSVDVPTYRHELDRHEYPGAAQPQSWQQLFGFSPAPQTPLPHTSFTTHAPPRARGPRSESVNAPRAGYQLPVHQFSDPIEPSEARVLR